MSEKFFDYLTRGSKENYISYHGVRVYREGGKEKADHLESMSAEDLYNYKLKSK